MGRAETRMGRTESLRPVPAMGEQIGFFSRTPETSDIGVAVCDRRFRFCAINHSLARFHSLPVEAHIGNSVPNVLGNFADLTLPQFEEVFVTGKPITGVELKGTLPNRTNPGYWVEDYFPITNSKSKVIQVCAVVVDVKKPRNLQQVVTDLGRDIDLALQEIQTAMEDLASHKRIHSDLAGSFVTMCQALNHSRVLLASSLSRLRKVRHDEQEGIVIDDLGGLSAREMQVFRLVAEGYSNKQVANVLVVSVRTVESHRSRIMYKLGVTSFAALVRLAVRSGLVQP